MRITVTKKLSPYCTTFSLEHQDKTEPGMVSDGYGVSLAFRCLMEMTQTVQILVMGEIGEESQGKEDADVTDKDSENVSM